MAMSYQDLRGLNSGQIANRSYIGGVDDGLAMKEQKISRKPVDIARETLEAAMTLSQRIEAVVNDILGPLPPMPRACVDGDRVGGPDGPGVLPALQHLADRTASEIRDAHAALDRLREVI